ALLLVTFAFATALQGQHWAMALVSYCQSDNLDCQGASYSEDGKVLILSATDGAPARLTAPPTQYGLPQDWTGHDSLYLDVHVTTKAAIQLKLELIGRRSILPFHVAISDKHSPGLPLQELPLAGSSYSPVEIKISFETPGSVSIDRIYLSRKGNELRPAVDTFGQRLLQEWEEMESWHKLSGGRPILIGEHHVPLDSKRQLPPKYPNFTSAERHEYYLNYVQTWAKMPFAVGCHWYQFKDQSLTGRGTIGGENQTIGLVDITDQPHQPLIDAVRKASRQMYIWHHSVTQ
ncbi:MAG: hypothetical protein HRU12_25400, partial [Phaeodactylibacter sp.]|nr:hypothetical protein [Phaeodactylibacter sp.]